MDDVNINIMDEEEFEVLSDDSDDLPSSSNKPVNKVNEEEFDVLSDASDDLPPSSKAVKKNNKQDQQSTSQKEI